MSVLPESTEDKAILVDLVSTYPLAWLVSPTLVDATLLPLMPVVDDQQTIVAIEGHMARSNPHIKTLETEKSATILYKGPDAYMPTEWVENKKLAPTWMFASATFLVSVELLPSDEDTREHLKRLVTFMEVRHGSSWDVEMMQERFDVMSRKVIAFRATVQSVNRRFKLGQNEEADVLKEMIAGLDKAQKSDIAAWMKKANSRVDW